MKNIILLLLAASTAVSSFGQIQFQKIYSGVDSEWATAAI